jgi:hypothetical protein
VVLLLQDLRTQADSLQKLTGRWIDRITRHATEPNPVDVGLMALLSAVADRPATNLTTMRVTPAAEKNTQHQMAPLVAELINSYIALRYYFGVGNVAMQTQLPAAADFQFMANSINAFHEARV